MSKNKKTRREEAIENFEDRMRSQSGGPTTPEEEANAEKFWKKVDEMVKESLISQGREDLVLKKERHQKWLEEYNSEIR